MQAIESECGYESLWNDNAIPSHTVLEPGQVIANFVTTKKAPVRT